MEVFMISLNITEIKSFMANLFTNMMFDQFLLRELDVQTFSNYHISGQCNETFFTKEELEERSEDKFVLWSEVRKIALAMIKGNRTPLSLKIVFQLSGKDTENLVKELAGKLNSDDVGGLFINIRFENGELHIITGTAIKTFTLDKSLEQEWDTSVKNFLKKQGVAFEET